MLRTPTLLMKELNYLRTEATRLHSEDLERSYAPIDDKNEYKYDTGYSYESNRQEIERINKEELKIRSTLAKFNSVTKVKGLDLTIAEALVKIAQLKEEIKVLKRLADRREYEETAVGSYAASKAITTKINYNQNKVKIDLNKLLRELSAIQIAVDETNLTTQIEY